MSGHLASELDPCTFCMSFILVNASSYFNETALILQLVGKPVKPAILKEKSDAERHTVAFYCVGAGILVLLSVGLGKIWTKIVQFKFIRLLREMPAGYDDEQELQTMHDSSESMGLAANAGYDSSDEEDNPGGKFLDDEVVPVVRGAGYFNDDI